MEVILCNTKVAMKTLGMRHVCAQMKKKMADSRFALSNQNIVVKLEENAKNKNTTQIWLNVWQTWAIERKKLKNTSMNNSQSKTSAT